MVIEDDYPQANDLTLALELQGNDVVGPFPGPEGGLKALTSNDVEAAVLDIRIGEDTVYEVADSLTGSRVPFMFVTGSIGANTRSFSRGALPAGAIQSKEMTVALAITVTEHARRH
ncbi:hypothetical protein [Pararhizobium sp. DWP1-1-3]|uniref:hypothetical protein n=1 Tax=Pararhizobium sp. DWP1-1-3 TaxID=2804652 RepID=UPI003CF6DB1F